EATIVPDPSWTCGMPGGIPVPERGELVFRATLELGETHDVGKTQFGQRRLLDVKGGTLTGDGIQATFLTGGMDLELTLSNGAVELEQINILRASDGTLIYLRTCGVAPAGDEVVRIIPDFEAPNSSSLAWLNTGKFAGTRVVDAAAGTIELEVYDISEVAAGEPKIQLEDPEGVPDQSWECSTATGARGSSVFTETVTLGSSLSVGASKRGSRNIIPITGGTVTGGMLLSSLSGSVLPGGADYQLIGATTTLDARYALSSNDGEVILVRNCGPFGALIPVFETRADGPYAILNTKEYVSSDPGGAAGGVSLTFYERR
ncbi:cellulosome protein dockerin type I, partial [Sorangium cellulosum]